MFSHPRSFAVDLKGNIYVADRSNHAIRKISKSGVTTIAGGYSKGPGKMDGPAQSASFSEDFELIFISERCSLLISDRGNRLVREMILKHEDCAHSQLKLGSTWVWALGLGIACLLSLAMWLAAHRFLARTGRLQPSLFQQDMEALPNHSGDSSSDNLLRHQKRSC
nr:TPA_asm: hypothetical protein HUJ06_009840 [Nelumbo nucifera]